MKDLGALMRQAQEMQTKMAEMQQKLEATEVEGVSGGGLVKVRLNGKHALMAVTIDDSLMKPEEREIVEDLIKAAHEDARRRIEQVMQDQMAQLTGGLGGMMPGFKLPF
jgi:DNA-binding YbaB/EbfC family protein